ncbi:MAG: hypothetical protein COB53_13180 [Elusimicrobia bacterium]|nr:MAG: hypothetical protein COB53_13180 [Elusimicrobiota bacterium]
MGSDNARPRERLCSEGPGALTERELLAALLGTGVRGMPIDQLSEHIIQKFPDGALFEAGVNELMRIEGLGPARAASLVAALELGRRSPARSFGAGSGEPLRNPLDVWRRLPDIRASERECFAAFDLDAAHRVLDRRIVSIGTLTESLVHPREVFAPALERRAAALLVAHNHPSGDPRPSPEDRAVTRRLAAAGRLLGVPLLDHIIVSAGRWDRVKV